MKLTMAIWAALSPSLGLALIGNDWSFSSVPSDGLKDITFPFNMANAPHTSGYYFAQQFRFNNVDEVAYTGLQPRSDYNGNSVVHAVFSSFQGGTNTTHPYCHDGADGGPGVSCAAEIYGDYSHTYNLVIENTGGTTWRGTLVDTVTGNWTDVGEWTLPDGAGGIKNGEVGFAEAYEWQAQPSRTCSSLPKTEAFFGNPTSNTNGASGGEVTRVFEYGDCVGKAGHSASQDSSGWDVKVGFV